MSHILAFDTLAFRKSVSEISEYDDGDFRRAANVYLSSLRDELYILNDKFIDQRLDKMQMYLQFAPNWNVGTIKDMLTKDTNYLDDLLHGHSQDWESASSSLNFWISNTRYPPIIAV